MIVGYATPASGNSGSAVEELVAVAVAVAVAVGVAVGLPDGVDVGLPVGVVNVNAKALQLTGAAAAG